jgi:hypothetical protein
MLILTLAAIALAPPKFHDPQPGDQFRYSLVNKYTYSPNPTVGTESGTRTTTFSKSVIHGVACLKERTVTDSAAYGRHHTEIYAVWRRDTKPKGQAVAYSQDDGPPLILHSISYHDSRDLKPGTAWSEKFSTPDGSVSSMTAKALRWETVTCPAGKFPCLVLNMTQTESSHGHTQTTQGSMWWAVGIGAYPKIDYVESTFINAYYGTLRKHYTLQLTSYHLASK